MTLTNNRRGDRRRSTFAEVSYECQEIRGKGRLSDISAGGFFIQTHNPLPEGSVITFRFVLPRGNPDMPVTGQGTVIWQKTLQGMGIRFDQLNSVDEARIKAYLARH
jgi:c-di-GMP-binding flagellar brake protein YcgR